MLAELPRGLILFSICHAYETENISQQSPLCLLELKVMRRATIAQLSQCAVLACRHLKRETETLSRHCCRYSLALRSIHMALWAIQGREMHAPEKALRTPAATDIFACDGRRVRVPSSLSGAKSDKAIL